MAIIDNAIYGGIPSSPLYEPQDIQDNLLVIASRTTVTHRPGAEVFDDIDVSIVLVCSSVDATNSEKD